MIPATTKPSGKSSISPAVWVFIAAFAVRLWVLSRFFNSDFRLPDNGDMKFYNDWALRILHGQWTDHQAFYGLPGYPFFLAIIYGMVGWFADFKWAVLTVGLLQTAAEAATCVLIYKIALEIFGVDGGETPGAKAYSPDAKLRPRIVGALAAAGWVFFQPAQTFSIIIMPTSWMILAFWWVVWYLLRLRRASVWNPWPWLGFLIGVVTMMVATILFIVPLVLIAIFMKLEPGAALRTRLPKALAACALFFAGLFAGVSPCAYHNYFIAHEPVMLSAHSGLNFFIGNNPIANGYTKIPPGLRAGQEGMLQDSILWAERAEGRKLKRVEVSHYWSALANAYIHEHPVDWLGLMCLKFKNFWNAYQYDDLSLVTMFANVGIITPGLKFGFVAALAIPGLLVAFRKYRRSRWVIAAIFLHMASLMTVFITERYRMAAVPGLLLMAAIGLWECWSWLARAQWRQPALYAAGCAAAVFFVALPVTDGDGLWSLDYYNSGFKAAENAGKDREKAKQERDTGHADEARGDLESAKSNLEDARQDFETSDRDMKQARIDLETAFAYVPYNSEINFALGNWWLAKDDPALAKAFYLRAIMVNSRNTGAFNNLGTISMDDGQWPFAAACFEKVVLIEPGDAKAWYLLAKAREGGGDLPGADKAIKQALTLVPDQKQFQQLAAEIAERMQKQ